MDETATTETVAAAELRQFIAEYAERMGRPHLLDIVIPPGWPVPLDWSRGRFRRRWIPFLDRIIAARRASERDRSRSRSGDLLDLLAAARNPDTGAAFTPDELRDQVATMILAGHETTAGTLFWAAMAYNLQPRGAAHVFRDAPPEAVKVFGEDRKAMAVNMARLRPADATSAYRSYLRRIANMVDEHDFLFGMEPCVADFAAYHGIWFTRTQVPPLADILNATPSVAEWANRVEAIGHGASTKLSAADAIAIAAAAEPEAAGANLLVDSAFQDDHGIPLGTRVTVTPESFGTEATEGELIAATRTHYSLRREDPRAGVVHVHFPRIGYVLRAASPA